jgi:hypothetical protein
MADNEDDLVDYDEEEVRAWLRQCGSRSKISEGFDLQIQIILCVYGCNLNNI